MPKIIYLWQAMQNITEKMDEKTFSLVKNNPELWNLFPWPLN